MSYSLNAIFRQASDPKNNIQQLMVQSTGQSSINMQQRVRQENANKKKDIKFPVTPIQREELRRLAKAMRIENRDPTKKYETISNTDVIKKALEQNSIFPERYPPLVYTDTGQYMHVEPVLRDYEKIEELAMKWNLSIRKTAYRLIMNYIYKGEVDLVVYRADR
jgi:hypothetical protein